jgi:FlaA1/EpsC-like NDP-sugar epimerase
MGATKRVAEMILQALNKDSEYNQTTIFSMVRFGHVLDSSGSVVPLFRSQINRGGPITLTHKDVTRYFMTIPEAAQLVIQSASMAKGGDIFILDMGEPVLIKELAIRMINFSGLTLRNEIHPEGDIEIEITGLRPGEKLFEELLIGRAPHPTQHPKIMMANEDFIRWDLLEAHLLEICQKYSNYSDSDVKKIIMKLIQAKE